MLTCFVTAAGLAPTFPTGTEGRSADQQLASRCLTFDLILLPLSALPTSSDTPTTKLPLFLPPEEFTGLEVVLVFTDVVYKTL